MSLRRCGPGDEAALSAVGQASFLEAFAGILPVGDILSHCAKQHAIDVYARWLAAPDTALWMAEASPGAAPVGYLVLCRPDLPLADLSSRDLEVKRVYLLHRFQKRGLGRALLSTAEEHARACGSRRLLLGVYSRNTDALDFYEGAGYRRVGERAFLVGAHTYHDYILARSLDA